MSSSSKFRGIFSNRMNNYTDVKWPTISQWISAKLSTLKSPFVLTDVLYYTVNNTESVTFIPYTQANSPYSGITTTHMTTEDYEIDINTLITFVGYRIVPATTESQLSVPLYNETITLQNTNGMLVATTTYEDAGDTFVTTKDSQTYMVLNGTGKYDYAKSITIYFNNDAGTRMIKVYSYQ